MDEIISLMRSRHSVRQYLDRPVPPEIREQLDVYVRDLNAESGLSIQTVYDEPKCFGSAMARYGRFENCTNYISMVGRKSLPDLEEKCGFYGEKLVLKAQELGLNTCWVALTHGKSGARVEGDETEVIIISLGYGRTQGIERRSKTACQVSNLTDGSPEWFRRGVQAALLAPTAVNQQKFTLEICGNTVRAEAGRIGPCLKIDLGIVKCHFELAAGRENFAWADGRR